MSTAILWRNRLSTRLGGMTLLLLAGVLLLIGVNFYTTSVIQDDAAALGLSSKGRYRGYQLLYLSHRLFDETGEAKKRVLEELRQVMDLTEQRFEQLLHGDPSLGIAAATHPEIIKETR